MADKAAEDGSLHKADDSETEETNIRRLVIMSIKRQDLKSQNLPDAVIEKQIRRYDCHQTSLAAQRKVLLILFVKRDWGFTLPTRRLWRSKR